ncbi:MAG TPA: response regulator [Myxococcota bacterium]|nr:response regulator [Myxococcota bacterium]
MKAACPGCGTPYTVADDLAGERLVCGNCQTPFRPREAVASAARAAAGARVLVAHENARVCEVAAQVLREAGFRALLARDGVRAREVLAAGAADALVADVALPGVAAFQLCDWLRGAEDDRLRALPVVLVASVFRNTAYKRRPARLYGADDYVEQHHIPDMLVPKVARLLQARGVDVPGDALVQILGSGDPAIVDALAAEERRLFEADGLRPSLHAMDAAEQRARRLAWIIVADLGLYDEAELERSDAAVAAGATVARSAGATYVPSRRLQADLGEARRLFERLVPESVRARADYFQEAFDRYVTLRGAGMHSAAGGEETA